MESLEISNKEPKCNSVYDNITSYIDIIESTNNIIKSEGSNHVYYNTIQTSCKKVKDIIQHDINKKPLCHECQIFNPLSKINKITNNFAMEINKKNIDVNIINEMNSNDIIINNKEILIDRLLVHVLKTIINNAPESSHIDISLSHNYPYLMIKISTNNYVYLNEKLIKDIMTNVEGEFNKNIIDNCIDFVFNIPLHSKLGHNIF